MNDKRRKHAFKTVLFAACAAAALAAGAAEEGEVVVISKTDKLPNTQVTADDVARIEPLLKALPDGHRLRLEFVTTSKAVTGYEHDIRSVKRATTTDAGGKSDGLELEFLAHYQRHSREAIYRNGVRDGPEKLYNQTGALTAEIPWVNGRIHGVKRTFHPDGKPANETAYDKGEIRGASRSFDAAGKVIRVVSYSNGQRDGDSTDYWPEKPEQVKQVVPYRGGVVEGVAKAFYLDGKPKWERPFKDNRQHGVEKQYDGDGKVDQTLYWLNGSRVSAEEYRKKSLDTDL
jgi:antitoxin component YwqK of YwqJK toxin-antitoxin module